MNPTPETNSANELYQKITDVCFENGGVTKPMVDKLYALINEQVRLARIDELSACLYIEKLSLNEKVMARFEVEERLAELREQGDVR